MRVVRLGDLVSVHGGGTPRRSTPEYYGGSVPWVTPKDMKRSVIRDSSVRLTPAGVQSSPAKMIDAGSVLVVVRSGVLKHTLPVALTEAAVTVNQDMKALTPHDGVNGTYLARFIKFMQPTILGWVRATTADNFPIGHLLDLDVPLPPAAEQRRIAAILDRADALRTKRRQGLAHLGAVTQSMFQDMFLGFPWPEEPLADVVKEGTLVTYGIVQAGEEFDGGVPYIRTGDIVAGRIVTTGLRRTSPAIAAKFERSTVRAGDIVMSIRATVGTTAVVPESVDGANLTQGTARIAPSRRALGPYLLGYLRSDAAQRWIQAQVKGATFREITLGRLRQLSVPLPPPELQQAFAARVAQVDAVLRSSEQALRAEAELFLSLQSRAFRGEL